MNNITSQLISDVEKFVKKCRIDECMYSSIPDGPETLYASCFAVMITHYIGELYNLPLDLKRRWIDYLNSWQSDCGLYIGPEVDKNSFQSPKHTFEHITMHLTAHVLPSIHLLGGRPKYRLSFADKYLERGYLENWLEKRNWKEAWLEGNNLLFIAQFLIHLRDVEEKKAQESIDFYFNWLDDQLDPFTGLWGTDGHCSKYRAMYGAYHQLIVYFYEGRDIKYKKELIDTVLGLQHPDGGFSPHWGGGACEDVDAINILVELYKRVDYRRPDIIFSLRRALKLILKNHIEDGGFVYRLNQSFRHLGLPKTFAPINVSNMFPTWFRIHALALISEILTNERISRFDWNFNETCSMGWHKKWDKSKHVIPKYKKLQELKRYVYIYAKLIKYIFLPIICRFMASKIFLLGISQGSNRHIA